MNRQFRLALLHDWEKSSPETVIDFTRFDLPAREAQELGRNWCLLGRINQKQVEAQPVGKNLRAHADFPWLGLEIA